MPVQTSVIVDINAPLERTFETAVSIRASDLIQKWGPLPGISETQGHDAPWSSPGQTREYQLTDNSSVSEKLTGFTRNATFAYNVFGFTSVLKTLVRDARAEWHFTQVAAGRTQIDWTYFFTPTNSLSEPVLWFFVKTLWPGYLRSALSRVKMKAENEIEVLVL